ncbi:hypothetical protein EC973_007665 [Apophysomyces ossiformis]|uniref:Chitin-binding protein n=1 Tax=Apophysomyces ossiformis TaxID=679940 RepID=A0A8H7BN84_9FUNG|nr:hypothetical protein EC973_007665 [Apophysomyces ossiformis]
MKSNTNSNSGNSWQGIGKASFFRGLSLISAISFLLLPVQEVSAHGALGFPLARQYGCRIDGGYYWPEDGSKMPSEGCRNAYLDAGKNYYPFNQWNEVSANPSNPDNMDSVMRAVPDGLLCAGGDKKKRGLDIPQNRGWRKTVIEPKNGKFQLRWENTRSHNPSTMKIYITKPSYNPSKPLRWADLDMVYDETTPNPVSPNGKGLLSGISSFYYLDVPIPANRTGDAIIYGWWQRIDAGHEGFFNCADVTIKQAGGATTPDKQPGNKDDDDQQKPDDKPDHKPSNRWIDEKTYLQRGITPKVGDKVRFTVTAGKNGGQTVVDVTLPITAKNVRGFRWSRELANTLNKKYKTQVKIGVQSGKSIKYHHWDTYENQVWLKSGYSSTMTLIKDSN